MLVNTAESLLLAHASHSHWAHESPREHLLDGAWLAESQVVDVRIDALSNSLGVLLDLRQSLQFTEVNTGLLLARSVTALHWTAPSRPTPLTAWSMDGASSRRQGGEMTFTTSMWPSPGADLQFTAKDVILVTAMAANLPAAPIAYTDLSRNQVRGHVPDWQTPIDVVGRFRL